MKGHQELWGSQWSWLSQSQKFEGWGFSSYTFKITTGPFHNVCGITPTIILKLGLKAIIAETTRSFDGLLSWDYQ